MSKNVNSITTQFGTLFATDVCFKLDIGHLPIQIHSSCFDGKLNDVSVQMITRCFVDS